MRKVIGSLAVSLFLAAALPTAAAAVRGDYLEARSSDVFTGPCFAMSEVGLTGHEAILAWKIREGDWKGVSLSGLSVVAVVRASATLGDLYHDPYPARSVLIVDSRATGQQRTALAEFAVSMAGNLLDHVVRVETAPIQMTVERGAMPAMEHNAMPGMEYGDMPGAAKLTAGKFVQIETRSLCAGDHLCGNESVYYPPLVSLVHSMPAFTLDSSYSGQGLGEIWKNVNKRSAFVGSF